MIARDGNAWIIVGVRHALCAIISSALKPMDDIHSVSITYQVLARGNDPNVTQAARMAPALYVVLDMAVAVARCAG